MKREFNIKYGIIVLLMLLIPIAGCEKYLDDTQLPANTIAGEDVYKDDNTVSTVVTGAYIDLNNSGPFTGSSSGNIGYTLGLYTDELKSLVSGNFADVFYKDAIQSDQSGNWANLYHKIFVINSAIEGINTTKAALTYKNQWLGESYFLRAFYYYYLVNIYGDVPLALTTDYKVNNALKRAPQSEIYQQIITDLKQAQTLLSTDYKNGYGLTTANRFRPNSAVATAFLARIYLYTKDWKNAEIQATALISNSVYQLAALNDVFLANSKETIWALATNSPSRSKEYAFYNNGMPAVITPPQTPGSSSILVAVSDILLQKFEASDGRFNSWLRLSTVAASGTNPAVPYYFPNKYKSPDNNAEYEVIFRLAEQYLIRAEARAQQNKITGANSAEEDLNAIRLRAGLLGTTASTQSVMLNAIAKERETELFTECGHRFFDLKRTGTIDEVMNVVAPQKGTTWQSYMQLWPIPPTDLVQDPNLTPNPGYLQ